MLRLIVTSAALALLLLQIPGCHFYVRATPEIIISDEPFTMPQNPTNAIGTH